MTTAADLNKCIDDCLALGLPRNRLLICEGTCETTFMQTPGNTETDTANGGKVFRDPSGAHVDVDSRGGKVFHPA